MIDGKPEKMQAGPIRVEVKGTDGQIATKESTLWSTRWGPVLVRRWTV
jgi:acyl-homoserine-lactone acylase